MGQLLVTRQRVDAAHRSPDNVSRLGASVEGSHPRKRAPSFAYKALSRSPPLLEHLFPRNLFLLGTCQRQVTCLNRRSGLRLESGLNRDG
jgi:hypothetical protein